MRTIVLGLLASAVMAAPALAQAVDPQPSCNMCQGTYVPAEEIQAYSKKAVAERKVDQQVRDVDIGKVHVALGVEHRGKLDAPRPHAVAEHDLVSEVYHIIDGSATLVTGPDIENMKRRPADLQTVREFNGPGNGGSSIRNGVTHQLKAGDVIVIPAGTGHWFTRIDDHIRYVMVRIDPDKVLPLKDEAQSKTYLSSAPAGRGKGKAK